MNEVSHNLDLVKINTGIADRSNVFYWQTDRLIDPETAGHIWADRHRYFSDNELVADVNQLLVDDPLMSIEPFGVNAQTNLGNVNSVRSGVLKSGKHIIVRCHPRGILNGYFHAEAVASQEVKDAGLPSYSTVGIHGFTGGNDFAFHVLEKLPGTAVKKWLEAHPESEEILLPQIGKMMARLHSVRVEGFGPFNNEKAKQGKLVGLHHTLAESVRAGLAFNLEVLVKEGIIKSSNTATLASLFDDNNPLLESSNAVLVHNDFADWNLLTDESQITGILDWDECVASDPVSDIACWSTFFDPERLDGFLKGYWQIKDQPADFKEKFELLRLRYILSKMTLRIRRYSWEPSEAMKEKIEIGKKHLEESLDFFDL